MVEFIISVDFSTGGTNWFIAMVSCTSAYIQHIPLRARASFPTPMPSLIVLTRTRMHWETVTDDDKFATLAGFDVEKERCAAFD